MGSGGSTAADVEFFFDPVCPFCWVASQWVKDVADQRGLAVRWRLLSVRLLNEAAEVDDPHPDAHRRGLEMLRVCAAVRAEEGPGVIGGLYTEMGRGVWEAEPAGEEVEDVFERVAQRRDLAAVLRRCELPGSHAAAAGDDAWDDVLRTERDQVLERVGGRTGTPVISFDPPDGPAFFGPLLSAPLHGNEATELWDAVRTVVEAPGFSGLQREVRELPRTRLTSTVEQRTL
jgi:2-hydroxychromene-2-carboxylate isomerase